MKRSTARALTLLLALASLGAASGCRRVTVVSFRTVPGMVPEQKIDMVIVDPRPLKGSLQLSGLDEQVGFYDLPGDELRLTVYACGGGHLLLINLQASYPIISDTVLVDLSRSSDPTVTCPVREGDGGIFGAGGRGEGGGGAGGAGGGGATLDGGDASAGGSGGAVDAGGAGGCPDAGPIKVDAGACPLPQGDPAPADVPMVTAVNPACTGYCASDTTTCPGTYSDVTQCERYCTLAGWPAGTPGTIDHGDTVACRQINLDRAAASPASQREGFCIVAGPSGGTSVECGSSVGPCGKFCQAWAGICGGSASNCLTTCAAMPATAINCRFPWLLSASADSRYCQLVDPNATCWLPGC